MSPKKPVLLIDQDDVIAEYIKGVVEAYNHKYHTCFSPEDCKSWDLIPVFGKEVLGVMHEPDLFRALEPVEEALEVFKRLYESNLFEMYIVTAAHPDTVAAKHEWVKKHMPFFPVNRLMICSLKYMIKGDYLLDDGMHNITAFAEHGGTPIVFDRPHNQEVDRPYNRVKSWLEFEEWIMEECYPELVSHYIEEKVI